jgi:hypothetical protein
MCTGEVAQCLPTLRVTDRGLDRPDRLFVKGYDEAQPVKAIAPNQELPGFDKVNLHLLDRQQFVVKFRINPQAGNMKEFYAQVMVVAVRPRQGGGPSAILGRGLQIGPVQLDPQAGDIDYSGDEMGRIHRPQKLNRTFVYLHELSSGVGWLPIEIIAHRGADPHHPEN